MMNPNARADAVARCQPSSRIALVCGSRDPSGVHVNARYWNAALYTIFLETLKVKSVYSRFHLLRLDLVWMIPHARSGT